MSEPARPTIVHFPKAPLVAAALLLAAVCATIGLSRVTDMGASRVEYSVPAETRELRFVDREDGTVSVLDARSGTLVEEFAPGGNGFIRIVMRGLARERMLKGIGADPAFQLTRWEDGRLSIADPATGKHIELVGFGSSNVDVFRKLLLAGRTNG